MSPVAVDKIGVVGKKSKMYVVSLQQTVNHIPQIKYQYRSSFLSDYVPTPYNDSFAFINTQPSNMQGEHCIIIANCRRILYVADCLGRKVYSFLNQQSEEMMLEPIATIPSKRLWFLHDKCGFPTLQIPTRKIYRSPQC